MLKVGMLNYKNIVYSCVFSSLLTFNALADNYCAGIRGNGELAPAHWSALSRIVENKGMPSAAAGGSSAAITLFFLDALTRNKTYTKHDQALLLKSLMAHIEYLYRVDAQSPVVMKAVGLVQGMGDGGFFHKLKSAIKIARDVPTFLEILGEYGPLLNPEIVIGLKKNFSFHKSQLSESIKFFGAFDAKEDMNIFFREGLVDFKYLALLFGRVADFYAGYGSAKTNIAISKFLNACSSESVGLKWSELMVSNPECGKLFNQSLHAYYKKSRGRRSFPNKMIFSSVGSHLSVFPTTALVVDSAAKRYEESFKKYIKDRAQNTKDFNLDFDTELKYGYWGDSSQLDGIEKQLKLNFSKDVKSQKFQAIKNGSWFEVLATSPSEPGLSNLQRIPDTTKMNENRVLHKPYFYKKWKIFKTLNAVPWFNEKSNKGVVPFRENMFSAGGWSDLHPTMVLKASGCEDIMYITRQNGESVFGQQIFIRLTGYTDKISFWKNIKEGNRRGWENLSLEEENSPWNKLYNLANPTSSFNKSLAHADSVYCTDWDSYTSFNAEGLFGLIDDSYNSPLFLKDEQRRSEFSFGSEFEGKSPDNFPGCLNKDFN